MKTIITITDNGIQIERDETVKVETRVIERDGAVRVEPAKCIECGRVKGRLYPEFSMADCPTCHRKPGETHWSDGKVLVLKANRISPKSERVYEFKYRPADYPEKDGLSKGVPLLCHYVSSVRVDPKQFYPTSKGLLPFEIIEHDSYAMEGLYGRQSEAVCFPVNFKVVDFEWVEDTGK